MTARAEIAAITMTVICPCGASQAAEFDLEQDAFGAWATPYEERFILCEDCHQLFDAGVEISITLQDEVHE